MSSPDQRSKIVRPRDDVGSDATDPRKVLSNNNCIRKGIRIDPYELSIFD